MLYITKQCITSNLYKGSQLVSCVSRLIISFISSKSSVSSSIAITFAFASSYQKISRTSQINAYYSSENVTPDLLSSPGSLRAMHIIQQSSFANIQLYYTIIFFLNSLNGRQLATLFLSNAYYLRISLYLLIVANIARLRYKMRFQL